VNGLFNLHILLHHGENSHHISEAIFKGTARALRQAVAVDPRQTGVPSSKGKL
jgi:imidazoleglycerol-phosphate dehydratase